MPPVRHLNIYLALLLQEAGHNNVLSFINTFILQLRCVHLNAAWSLDLEAYSH